MTRPPKRYPRLIRFALLLASILPSCNLNVTATPPPTIPPDVPVDSWDSIAPGLERRVYLPPGSAGGHILTLRVDPDLYTFRSHYRPSDALNVTEWQEVLPNMAAFINSNFYDAQDNIVGLLVADGVAYGQSYQNRGGRFVIQDDMPHIIANSQQPYQGEPLQQAVQAFPMLVQNGEQVYFNRNGDRVTRRTAIGIDTEGRVLLMTTPLFGLMLADLSAFLANSDMNLVDAFNLDGGGSTMMAIAPTDYTLISRDPVPAVLAIYPR